MTHIHHHVYSAEKAASLKSGMRKFLMNPEKTLAPLIQEGITILEVGCGPGLFTLEAARLVGPCGRVIAADLQQAMLDMVRESSQGTDFGDRIVLHKCSEDRIGVTEPVDLILAIHVVHELPDRENFFDEMKSIIRSNGTLFLMEPAFVVPAGEFDETLVIARKSGFRAAGRKRSLLSRVAVLKAG
jgi:ubiquinone/menaquinone biosynthesis C-methylase UbiE